MPLPYKTDDLENVPEAVRDQYEEQGDGSYRLVLNDDPSEKVNEFRENNVKLMKEQERLKKQLESLPTDDAEAIQEAMDAKKKLDEMQSKKLLEEGQVDQYLEQRTKEMRDKYEEQLSRQKEAAKRERERYEQLHSELATTKVKSALSEAISDVAQPKKGAMDDILRRGREDWQVDENGELKPRDGLLSVDGEPITRMSEYAKHLAKSADYLFEAGGGSGGAGGKNRRKSGEGGPRLIPHDKLTLSDKDLEDIASGAAKIDRPEE